MKPNPLRHQREAARITAMQYADAAVRNAALERENERHKKQWHAAEGKAKGLLAKRRAPGDQSGRHSQQQAQTEGSIAAAKLSTTENDGSA